MDSQETRYGGRPDTGNISGGMDMDDKLRLLNGKTFWRTYANEKYGIREIVFADGPTGLRFQEGEADHLGMGDSSPATCFPTPAALSCSWDPALAEEVSACIAREAIEKDVDVVLAPGVNLKRSPLCGRNFEYYSEDPMLSGELGAAFVNGLQKNGVGASLKHFAANNQEAGRMSVNVTVDERALHELYLAAFKKIITTCAPWTVMSAYNRLLGSYCSENRRLLTELLRDSWKYDGLVLSDWYAVNDIVKSINNGLDLEMPSVGDLSYGLLQEAYKKGELEEAAVNRAVEKIAGLAAKCDNRTKANAGRADFERHHETARRAAGESFVLLKNNHNSLPLRPHDRVLLAGELMNSPVIQGNGSSRVHPYKLDSIAEELRNEGISYRFRPGYRLDEDAVYPELVNSAVEAAASCNRIIVFAGLFSFTEAEGYDRESLRIPRCQEYLIDRLSRLGKRLVVVLQTGSAVEMPWLEKVDAVLQMHLAGQGCGKALADVLAGKVNPCGKLTETYPLKLEDTPSYLFKGNCRGVAYGESIFVGYRYYDKKGMEVLFPFGHGLSYTEFEYSGLKIDRTAADIHVAFELKNIGRVEGKEIVQVYVCLNEDAEIQPVRKLAAFQKVLLKPGEKTEVSFRLSPEAFTYYLASQKEFVYATGINTVEVGKSSRDIVLGGTVQISENNRKVEKIHANTTIGELLAIPELKEVVGQQINELMEQFGLSGEKAVNPKELEQAMFYMPLRNVVQVTGGVFSPAALKGLIDMLNGILGYPPV